MPPFDPIATPATRRADNREPHFVHAGQLKAAEAKIAEHAARHGRPPNVLVMLMDDVGWGDFGCYGGGVAVGAPTPNIDRLAREGLLLTSCYSEPSCTPSRASLLTGRLPMRHGLQRPPMYGEPGGLQGEITLAELLSDAGYVTQAVGKWHLGENAVSQPQHCGFDDFYGFLSVSDMYTEWRDPYFFPEVAYREARTEWVRTMPFNKCFVHATRGERAEQVEEVTIPVLSRLDEKWADYSQRLHRARMAGGERALVPLPLHPRRPLRQLPARAVPRRRPRPATPTRTRSSSWTTSWAGWSRGSRRPASSSTRSCSSRSDNGPEMETWPDAAYTPFRCAKGSTWEGGVRVPGIFVVARDDRPRSGQSDGLFSFTDLLPTVLHLAGADDARCPTTGTSTGSTSPRSSSTPTGCRTASTTTTGWAQRFSALRVGEYKFMLTSISDDDADVLQPRRVHGHPPAVPLRPAVQPLPRPQGDRTYLIRKLVYVDALTKGARDHVHTFAPPYQPKLVVGINF